MISVWVFPQLKLVNTINYGDKKMFLGVCIPCNVMKLKWFSPLLSSR